MIKLSLFISAAFFCFVLVAGCNSIDQAKPAADKDSSAAFSLTVAKKEIEEANRNFSDLLAKGDSIGLANCYSMDAKMMGPNEPATVGRKNIQTAIAGLMNAGVVRLALTTTDVWGTEALLAEEGELTVATKDKKQIDKGKYLVLWKKEDGKWKLFRDLFNSDLPIRSAK
jgi:ketosteroid isomerase-like protein